MVLLVTQFSVKQIASASTKVLFVCNEARSHQKEIITFEISSLCRNGTLVTKKLIAFYDYQWFHSLDVGNEHGSLGGCVK